MPKHCCDSGIGAAAASEDASYISGEALGETGGALTP